jgi:VanZ family protein
MIKFLEKRREISFILFLFIAIEIFYVSSIEFTPGSGGISLVPLVYHFTVFFLFNTFLLATIKGGKEIKSSHLLIVILFSFIYSILDEVHQAFVPGRSSAIEDLIVNNTGILLSTVIYLYKERSNNKLGKNRPSSEAKYENEHVEQLAPQRESYY